jgi:hypothetical protein
MPVALKKNFHKMKRPLALAGHQSLSAKRLPEKDEIDLTETETKLYAATMKKPLILFVLLAASLSAQAQGAVEFVDRQSVKF